EQKGDAGQRRSSSRHGPADGGSRQMGTRKAPDIIVSVPFFDGVRRRPTGKEPLAFRGDDPMLLSARPQAAGEWRPDDAPVPGFRPISPRQSDLADDAVRCYVRAMANAPLR